MCEDIITPNGPVFLVESDPANLLEIVERGYIASKMLDPPE